MAVLDGFVSYNIESDELLHLKKAVVPASMRPRDTSAAPSSVILPGSLFKARTGYCKLVWSCCNMIIMSIAECIVNLVGPDGSACRFWQSPEVPRIEFAMRSCCRRQACD